MVVVRCTRKLLDRLAQRTLCEVTSTTTLGDWYATILFTKPRHVVLLVNAATRLSGVVPARSLSTLSSQVAEGLATVLTTLDISPEVITAELREMRDVTFTTTASRSVLGTMTTSCRCSGGGCFRWASGCYSPGGACIWAQAIACWARPRSADVQCDSIAGGS
jgi:hypothetical protein